MPEPEVLAHAVGPGRDMGLWSTDPQLPRPRGGQPNARYEGRLAAEVWDRDVRIVTAAPHSAVASVVAKVREALRTQSATLISDTAVAQRREPVTGQSPGQAFRGRVVAEVWSDQVVVGVSGSDRSLVEGALRLLNSR